MKTWMFVALATAIGLAQDPVQLRPGTGVVSGRVVHAVTGAPVAGAYVSVSVGNRSPGFDYPAQATRSAADGTFTLTSVAPGLIEVTASADGFLSGAFGRLRPGGSPERVALADTQRFADAIIRLWPEASIAGRVTNELGKPIANVLVAVLRVDAQQQLRLSPESASTDATGDYRIHGLEGGRYVVMVPMMKYTSEVKKPGATACGPPPPPPTPDDRTVPAAGPQPLSPPAGTLVVGLPRELTPPPPTDDGGRRTYRTVFVPGADAPDIAAAFELPAGHARDGIDITLWPTAAHRIGGHLIDPTGALKGEVTLSTPGVVGDRAIEATTFLRPDGSFVFLDVPAGRYRLSAQRFASVGCDVRTITEGRWSGGTVDIGAGAADALALEFHPRVTVTGRINYKGTASRARHITVLMVPLADPGPLEPGYGQVSGEKITVSPVRPGRYAIYVSDDSTLSGARWWPLSVVFSGVDTLGRAVDVGNIDDSSLVITMTDAPSPLEGTVHATESAAVSAATVVVFPADRSRWSLEVGALRPYHQTQRVKDGRYHFDHLPSGDYYVAAVNEIEMDAWPSAPFLERVRGSATRVVIRDGQRSIAALQVQARR